MTIEDLQAICKKLTGVTQDIKWDDHLCFNIGDKMFLVTSPDSVPPSASFKVADDEFEHLTEKEGFSPQRHMARYKWISVDDISRLSNQQWQRYIEQSYLLVASKLSLKLKKQIGLL